MSRRVTVEELQQSLDESIQGVADRGDEIVVERNGQPLAAVVPMREYEALKRSRDRFWELIELNRAANRDVDPTEVEAAVEQAIREVREERRAKRARNVLPE